MCLQYKNAWKYFPLDILEQKNISALMKLEKKIILDIF